MDEPNSEIKLGFGESPDSVTYVFVGGGANEHGATYPWYTWDHAAGAPVGLFMPSLTGFIKAIYVTKHEYKGQHNFKLNIKMLADKPYVVRAGIGTTFSRGIMLGLESLMKDGYDFEHIPVSISIKASPNDEKVFFGNVYNWRSKERAKTEWDPERSLLPIVNQLQEILGQEIQTKEKLDQLEVAGQKQFAEFSGPPQETTKTTKQAEKQKEGQDDIPF